MSLSEAMSMRARSLVSNRFGEYLQSLQITTAEHGSAVKLEIVNMMITVSSRRRSHAQEHLSTFAETTLTIRNLSYVRCP